MKRKMLRKGICLPLLLITVLLTCIGVVMVISSSYNSSLINYYKQPGNSVIDNPEATPYLTTFFVQIGVAAAGFLFLAFAARIDYHIFSKPSLLISGFIISIVTLSLVFLFPAKNDSHRWIPLGPITFQPSEIAKFVCVFYTAFFTAKNKWWYRSIWQWVGLLTPTALCCLLIMLETDLSATITLLGAVTIILFISGMQWKFLIGGIAGIGALIPLAVKVFGYQGRRFQAWLHAWDDPKNVGYQVVQSLYAIGDGGLFGVGLGNSKQKITHLPMSETDYIFSIICEEFGFVGAFLVVALYAAFAFFGIKIALEASDSFGAYLAAGITTLIVLQSFINMGVATNILPSTGVTLPFISKGATSLGVSLLAVGVLLSVSSHKSADRTTAP